MSFPPAAPQDTPLRIVREPGTGAGGAPLTLDLWLWPLAATDAQRAGLAAHLSPDERTHADAFRVREAGEGYVVGRGRMREILAGYMGCAPAAVPIRASAHGKPHLAEGAAGNGPSFNLSHAGGWAALAVGPHGLALGIDIEPHRPISPGLPERWLSPAERAELATLADGAQAAGFFNAWTRKEALLKALGAGLSRPLDSFDVTLAPGAPARLTRLSGARIDRWRLIAFDLRDGFPGCIAVRHAGPVDVALREGVLPLPGGGPDRAD